MNILKNFDLSNKNTFRLASVCDFYVELSRKQDLLSLVNHEVFKNASQYLVLGGGSNLILPRHFSGLVIHPAFKGIENIYDDEEKVLLSVGAGEDWSSLIAYCLNEQFFGLENLSLIPGKVGASPIQNIGAYGVEVEQFIDSVEVYNFSKACFESLKHEQCQFSYRDSIFKHRVGDYLILSVNFLLSKTPKLNCSYQGIQDYLHHNALNEDSISQRELAEIVSAIRRQRLPHPDDVANVGSFFKNPVIKAEQAKTLKQKFTDLPVFELDEGDVKLSAAWLIDQSQLKSVSVGNVKVSEKHALVLENTGEASQQEVLELANKVKQAVQAKFEVQLEIEPVLIS